MGFDYHVNFDQPDWYTENRDRVEHFAVSLRHFVRCASPTEIWLKDESISNSWPYDLRLFLKPQTLDIEVAIVTETFSIDLVELLEWIRKETSAELVDDDGTVLQI